MDTIKISEKKQTKIIAHRGGNLEIENTNAAFISSCNRSYYGIETDVHRTADGKYVIYHDDETKRLMDKNLNVEKTDLETLRTLKFNSYMDRIVRADSVLPTLDEYIDICKNYEKFSVIELKNPMNKQTVFEIYNTVEKSGQIDKTIFISFDFKNLILLRKINPLIPVQFLIDAKEDGLKGRLKYQNFDMEKLEKNFNGSYQITLLDTLKELKIDIDVYYYPVEKEFITECQKRNIKINLWTVDDIRFAKKFIDLGVDYITTNCLE